MFAYVGTFFLVWGEGYGETGDKGHMLQMYNFVLLFFVFLNFLFKCKVNFNSAKLMCLYFGL